MKNGRINVFQQLVNVGTKHILRDLKTKSSKRTIAVPEEVINALKALKEIKKGEYADIGFTEFQIKQMLSTGLVFTSEVGTPIEPNTFIRNYKSLLKTAKLPENLRFHDLRHTFALLSLQAGVDIKTLQSDLGHESIETTLDRCGHVNEDMKRAAADKRSRLLKTMND